MYHHSSREPTQVTVVKIKYDGSEKTLAYHALNFKRL